MEIYILNDRSRNYLSIISFDLVKLGVTLQYVKMILCNEEKANSEAVLKSQHVKSTCCCHFLLLFYFQSSQDSIAKSLLLKEMLDLLRIHL